MSIFSIYKPKGPTSHDIVNQVRLITGQSKVGHAGTLDPCASGVLVVAVGREATKTLSDIVAKEKEYLAEIKLGETSTTDDSEGEITQVSSTTPTEEKVFEAVESFCGDIMQTPPIYSALKVAGKPAHRRVRAGEEVQLEPRQVHIEKIKVVEYNGPILKLNVVTGPGVYIRALARDIGQVLGVGGYLAELERVRVGKYTKETSLTIDAFAQKVENERPT